MFKLIVQYYLAFLDSLDCEQSLFTGAQPSPKAGTGLKMQTVRSGAVFSTLHC